MIRAKCLGALCPANNQHAGWHGCWRKGSALQHHCSCGCVSSGASGGQCNAGARELRAAAVAALTRLAQHPPRASGLGQNPAADAPPHFPLARCAAAAAVAGEAGDAVACSTAGPFTSGPYTALRDAVRLGAGEKQACASAQTTC